MKNKWEYPQITKVGLEDTRCEPNLTRSITISCDAAEKYDDKCMKHLNENSCPFNGEKCCPYNKSGN